MTLRQPPRLALAALLPRPLREGVHPQAFVHVHDAGDLVRTTRAIARLLRFRRERGVPPLELLGVWIAPGLRSTDPTPDSRVTNTGSPLANVLEVVEHPGHWSLLRLSGGPWTREQLVDDLLRQQGRPFPAAGSWPTFAPVHSHVADLGPILTELSQLRRRHPGRVVPPVWQDLEGCVLWPEIGAGTRVGGGA